MSARGKGKYVWNREESKSRPEEADRVQLKYTASLMPGQSERLFGSPEIASDPRLRFTTASSARSLPPSQAAVRGIRESHFLKSQL